MSYFQEGDPFEPRRPSGTSNGEAEGAAIEAEMAQGRRSKKFILCFDGTGNKFSGTEADSNILKIYCMLDRTGEDQFHYYQPGIGTYVTGGPLSHTSTLARMQNWYQRQKDSAVGTSFAEHVMGGYKFLMRYYSPGDEIYLFGFSRGAYTARFLAEMLDHVGLLSAGNEEMARFAWKAFQKWQIRTERNDKEKKDKKRLLDFMFAFRETFSRPVRRIRFLGLFDTVNSVPHFENAWMQRSKFPYTARSTAKVIRHAVAIDERRAKFRQDLISQSRGHHGTNHFRNHHKQRSRKKSVNKAGNGYHEDTDRGRAGSDQAKSQRPNNFDRGLRAPPAFRDSSETSGLRSLSPGRSPGRRESRQSRATGTSRCSHSECRRAPTDDSDDEEQDIKEVWFAGCHADIGGGWPLESGEESPLSHVPLVWMVREAQSAGLQFDPIKLRDLNCCPDDYESEEDGDVDQGKNSTDGLRRATAPEIHISSASPGPAALNNPAPTPLPSPAVDMREPSADTRAEASVVAPEPPSSSNTYHHHIHHAATRGRIHDVLQLKNGAPALSVLSWNIMEWMPFRRLDLKKDGQWHVISWPLPKGEVRDVPADAVVHSSVLARMRHDEKYRPGNIIVGGGGRGVRIAPREDGMGKWRCCREEGDAIGECFMRADHPNNQNGLEGGR